jgi:hypothetical protein
MDRHARKRERMLIQMILPMRSLVSWISASSVDARGEVSAVGGTLLDPRSSTCSCSGGDKNRESQSYCRIRMIPNER